MTLPNRRKLLPPGAFLVAVSLVCAGLAVSAGYSFLTLSQFRDKYLEKLGHDVGAAIELQTRGPANRTALNVWDSVLDSSLHTYQSTVAYLALVDAAGKTLAQAGKGPQDLTTAPSRYIELDGSTVYTFEEALPVPQRPDIALQTAGWRLRIGLYASPASFIMQQAYVQLAVAAIGIATLLGLAGYSMRTLRRFLALKSREESETHLASLGRMAATLAHEIRNPLGAMKGLAQLVAEDLPDHHNAQPLTRTIVSEAERLEQLITDLLSFSRPKEPRLSEFDVAHLIRDVVSGLQMQVDERELSLTRSDPGPLFVLSDENGLRQVLLNVLLNAIEATPRGGVISVIAQQRPGEQVEVKIEDTGEGLGNRDPEELFQPFTTTKAKGSGLGLAVSRQILERSGGRIAIVNRAEGGVKCSISLPIARAAGFPAPRALALRT